VAEVQLSLPVSIATKVDVGRLQRELLAVNEFLEQAAIRQPGTALTLPKTSRLMVETIRINNLNLLHEEDRTTLLTFLNWLMEKAPHIHMSFSTEPSTVFLQKLITYIRENLHPNALLQVGLQPTIGAGFKLRTTNKYYDFSLQTTLKSKHQILMQSLREIKKEIPVQAEVSDE
jgi:hypothetical protein